MIVGGRDLRSYQIPLSIYKLVLCPGPSEDILDFFFFFFTTLSDYFTTLSDYSFIHSSAFSGHLLSVSALNTLHSVKVKIEDVRVMVLILGR